MEIRNCRLIEANYLALATFWVCAGSIFYLVFRPEPPPELFLESDKVFHLIAFAGLGLVTGWAFFVRFGGVIWFALVVAALVLEPMQSIVQPARTFSYLDMLSNGAGVLLAVGFWYLGRPYVLRLLSCWRRALRSS